MKSKAKLKSCPGGFPKRVDLVSLEEDTRREQLSLSSVKY
jgi:hypothetical protein